MANKGWSQEQFITRCKHIHGDKYDYTPTIFTSTRDTIEYICKIHGSVTQQAGKHASGAGCIKCSHDATGKRTIKSQKEYLASIPEDHRIKFDYSEMEYLGKNYKILIRCIKHDYKFWQNTQKHRKGSGCPICSRESPKRKTSSSVFFESCLNKFGNNFDYSDSEYHGSHSYLNYKCNTCHNLVSQLAYSHENLENGCPFCGKSKEEREITTFLQDILEVDFISNDRTILNGKELDFYVPSLKIGIEHNGTYYHSELGNGKTKEYHLNKTLAANTQGIKLIQIFEDEWTFKKDICKSLLRHKLGKDEIKIFARKCSIKLVEISEKNAFLDNNHIQGKDQSRIKLGLYYNEELVALMTFGIPRYDRKCQWELIRFCVKQNTNVIGAASKLFSYFVKNYNPSSIISYADRRWSEGDLYRILNFNMDHVAEPRYYYMNRKNYIIREHRSNYTKDRIKQKFPDADLTKTEWQLMQEYGYDRIWDCGNLVYIWKKENPVK